MKNKNNKEETMVRINSRIFPGQHEFIKAEAKRLKIGEGELHRMIIQDYISHKVLNEQKKK